MQPKSSTTKQLWAESLCGRRLRRSCFAVAVVVGFGTCGAAFADHTNARAELTAHGEGRGGTCAQEACAGAHCIAYLEAMCTGGNCTISASLDCDANPCAANLVPVAAELFDTGSTTCDAGTLLGDLVNGPFVISEANWKTALATGLVTANLGAGGGGDVKVSGNVVKLSGDVPTVSEWGMLVMFVLVLAVGSVLLRRQPARC
ncbi:MAG: hypothetical protein IH987_06345 [Planctomycetes bacterium]|nr:hypothetical protein [Planctomycetota bacterium]